MTIAPLPQGFQQFLGPNGAVLASGTVANYISKTTFFKSTWSAPDQSVGNSNPVHLDSTGSATIYGFGAVRQVVLDAFGDTISDSVTFGGQFPQTVIVLNTADSGVWQVPNGVYTIYLEVVGGGGAGSDCLAAAANGDVSGGGGGAGGFANGIYSVTPGQKISYSVGKGGALGSQGPGATTNFGIFAAGNGGAGSAFLVLGTSVGGNGGQAAGGTILNIPGGDGTDGSHIPTSGGAPYIGAGNGGASFYGPGGTSSNGADGNSGVAPGSGGAGSMDVNLTNITFNGGAGADGQIIIKYWG